MTATSLLAPAIVRAMLLSLLLASPAVAADETDLPPALRGDLGVGWRSDLASVGLAEDAPRRGDSAIPVGRRREVAHLLAIQGTFAFVDGIALTGGVEHAPSTSYTFVNATRMLQDPATGQGSAAGGVPLTDPEGWRASGLVGWNLGVAFAPLSEHRDANAPLSWRLDLGFRSAPPRTLWELDESGRGGAGPGGTTFRAGAAFSRQYPRSSPYLLSRWDIGTPRFIDSVDAWGDPVAIQVDPGQRLEVAAGVELPLTPDSDSTVQANVDLSAGFLYQGGSRVRSGVLLPDVLPGSRSAAVQRAEHLGWHGSLAIELDLGEAARLRLWSRALWFLPYQVEHPYKIWTTAESLHGSLGAEVRLQWR